jgi:hypothetical protein
MRYATIAAVCVLSLAVGTDSAIASTAPAPRAPSAASAAVRTLRHAIRATRGLALHTAYVAALPAPPHGHAERTATTVAELTPILARWQGRLPRYRAALARRRPALAGLRCIHGYEGPWNAVSDSTPTYYGGLQMDRAFERAYGRDVLVARGGADADAWSRHDQLMVAMRAYRAVGYSPWPTTAAACGLA